MNSPTARSQLIDVDEVVDNYFSRRPDMTNPSQLVSFGTSGHRGTSLDGTFTDLHVAAITQAVCDYRNQAGITGPLFLGKDTHALSAPAETTALEVLAANKIVTILEEDNGFTPTPVISRAILAHNQANPEQLSDGIVVTPSHNPPAAGGFKYNPPRGGPADTAMTSWIQERANALLAGNGIEIQRIRSERAASASRTHYEDLVTPYVHDLENIIDFDSIRSAGLRIGVDPLGGASVSYWKRIAEAYQIDITVVNETVDPQFSFMPLDHDGKIRMDCSSPWAMANLVALKDDYDIAWGNDPDADRHGIVTPSDGLMNPNHFLAVAIQYLLSHRPAWPQDALIGKTAVSSGIIDRVVRSLSRTVYEVPVGFKWFADGLYDAKIVFGGEESAGASFLRMDGTVWTTDKDGIILGLLAAEITARTGRDPAQHFSEIENKLGTPFYRRVDQPATPEQRSILKHLTGESVATDTLAGEPILQKLTNAPGNGASLGGIKVIAANGWFAARPSGTENIYKIYAESFKDEPHLDQVISEASAIVKTVFAELH